MTFSITAFEHAFDQFCQTQVERFSPWTYDAPLFIDAERMRFLREAQRVMHRFIRYVSAHYPSLAPRMPHRPEVKALLHALADLPHEVGTFRTDFVVGTDGALALIEVTCRYPFNGYFTSIALNRVVDTQVLEQAEGLSVVDLQRPLLGRFRDWVGGRTDFCLVHGDDRRGNESNHLPALLQGSGLNFHAIHVRDWPAVADALLPGAVIMTELSFEEWLSLPLELVREMVQQPLINDPRTVFIVHDKAFFALAHDEALVAEALSAEEGAVLRTALAPTYLPGRNAEVWAAARANPAEWVLKPRSLGRSVDILAGHLIPAAQWNQALDEAEARELILQRWLDPRRIHGRVGNTRHEDYFVGTLLYWGLDFFGPGMFRASSYPITNVKDDRKVAYRAVAAGQDAGTHPHLQWL